VFPTTRSETSARNAQEKLRATSPGINVESIEWLQLDLADLKSIAAFSDKLKRQTTKIDILSMLQ
jgi:NADP-dependent 3-hydroxy acid dehydrogenase YdfG